MVGQLDTVRNFQAGSDGDILEISNSLASITQELWDTKGALYGVNSSGGLTITEASADGSNKVGVVVGTLADIQRLGLGSPPSPTPPTPASSCSTPTATGARAPSAWAR